MRNDWKNSELGRAVLGYRDALVAIAALSAVLNVLLLGGSLYMMLVYDSVLPSHSLPTLFGLLAMLVIVYVFQGFFDNYRSRLLNDVANGFAGNLAARVQDAVGRAALSGQRSAADGLGGMRDLDQIRGFLASGGPAALIDLPWILFFLAILFMLHVWLGVTALVGAILLLLITYQSNHATRQPTAVLTEVVARRNAMAESHMRHVEVLTALGMRQRMIDRWSELDERYRMAQDQLAHVVVGMGGVSKVLRLFLQSGILTVGALLVIEGEASAGVIFASSILAGRALAPVDQAIANWRGLAAARLGWTRLEQLLAHFPERTAPSAILPPPNASLQAQNLFVAPPGSNRLVVQNISFELKAGTALGIIGPSAAGKSSLSMALIGAWPAARGAVRLDGATLDQWEADRLGASIGFLPQTVELLDGTVAQNIARFQPGADSERIIAAARAANVHDMIVRLPEGYETPVGFDGSSLSAGQRQRIGLARALYGDPFLVLLDEPNSNLDAQGETALALAIASVRERGGICIVVSHRPSALANVNQILVLRDGQMDSFGPRDEVLEKVLGKPRIVSSQDGDPGPKAGRQPDMAQA